MSYVAQHYSNRDHKAIKVVESGSRSHSWSIFSILRVPGGGKRLWGEIRFPDAGKDEREMPAETGRSWGVWAWVGALWVWPYYCYLGPGLPETPLTSRINSFVENGSCYGKRNSGIFGKSQRQNSVMQCSHYLATFQRVHAAMHCCGSPFVMSQWQWGHSQESESVETASQQPCFCPPPKHMEGTTKLQL